MSSSLSLLAMPHSQAARVMVQEKLVPGVSVADLVIDTPKLQSGFQMGSKVYIAASAYNNPNWPYYGDVTFGYTALDMGDTFAGIPLAFIMPIQFTSHELAGKLADALQLQFDISDIVTETVVQTTRESTYVLRANPGSARWQGSVSIKIYHL